MSPGGAYTRVDNGNSHGDAVHVTRDAITGVAVGRGWLWHAIILIPDHTHIRLCP